ncbi:MAG: tetratricopeptide repeat protein [Sphingomonas sp.]|nr:tetratricopeptide repeat protein [Sphingomonas sp.]
MSGTDVNSLFARAERAFMAGRIDEARRDLIAVGRAAGDHPAVLHLLALVEKKGGNLTAARGAFERAATLAPNDAQLLGNHANLLGELDETDAALALYARAIAASPRFADARHNRALLLQRLGRLDEALAEFDALLALAPEDGRAHAARGAVLRQLDRVDDAATAFDAALRADPTRLTALHGRARVAMERGEANASELYVQALQRNPGDLELVLGLVEAFEAEGNPLGLELLTETAARHPGWIAGQEVLARMRAEIGETERFADHYVAALAQRPHDRALHMSHWRSLARGERHGEALAALRAARPALGEDDDILLIEAGFAMEAGELAEARALLDRLDAARPDIAFARGRVALRSGDPDQAAALFERVVDADGTSINGWANLDLAWRLSGDARHEWLSGQPGLYGPRDIGLDAAELARTAALLRTLHVTRAHPIGQSLRGGTQTRGSLFARGEPEIVRLRDAIAEAVRAHFAGLPPRDDRHPLLRHRDATPAFSGSWSVRLTDRGFHVNHIHPQGIVSSACYIALPDTIGDDAARDGWLELGRPPAELGLSLEPLAAIAPRPGRLALFPSYLFHGTRPFAAGERLTVAFDIVAR